MKVFLNVDSFGFLRKFKNIYGKNCSFKLFWIKALVMKITLAIILARHINQIAN